MSECTACEGWGMVCDACDQALGNSWRTCESCGKQFCAPVDLTCVCGGSIPGHPVEAGLCVLPHSPQGRDHFTGHECAA